MSALDPCLAVIPARGGSKGLPGKNIRPLAGIPLLGHALECARRVKRISTTIVSTDDADIARTARELGGQVPFMRPSALARDDAPMMPVLQHAVRAMEEAEQHSFGSLLLLDPTSPLRLPQDLEDAFQLLDSKPEADGVIACSVPVFNPFWVGAIVRDGLMVPAFPDAAAYIRRQDVPRFLRINGLAYLWRRSYIERAPDAWSAGNHIPLETPESRAFSIDDQREFDLVELILRNGLVTLPWLAAR